MRCYVTDANHAFTQSECSFKRDDAAEFRLVTCHPRLTFQTIMGFGAALTEASAFVFAQMPPAVQDDFLRLMFEENSYTLARTHIQSCDFSLGSYAYAKPHDKRLASFSIDHDRQLLLPFLRCCMAANPQLRVLATPWSPPAFLKQGHSMKGGGHLHHSAYSTWAKMIVKYLRAYEAEGVPISYLSVQNEPLASQKWESCQFSAEEERDFAVNHLRPALDVSGFEQVGLFAWDHNKDRILDRAEATYGKAPDAFTGVAFHWYTGDHFEQLQAVSQQFPQATLLFTEGCVEYASDWRENIARSVRKAEQYAHDIMGNLNAGTNGFIDWNALLDEEGGPNHVGNYCEAPLMYDRESQRLHVNKSFQFIGHFSRFIRPGAVRFLTSRFSWRLECAGFANPNGERVLVVLNRTGAGVPFRVAERPFVADCNAPAHAISTFIWSPGELA